METQKYHITRQNDLKFIIVAQFLTFSILWIKKGPSYLWHSLHLKGGHMTLLKITLFCVFGVMQCVYAVQV